jgi:hypothetical protein
MKNLYRNRYKERIMRLSLKNLIGLSFLYLSQISVSQSIEEIVEHKYAVNDGTSIHYAKAGTWTSDGFYSRVSRLLVWLARAIDGFV